jgi:hypothetical protein
VFRMPTTSSEPLPVTELAGESELLWLVDFAPVAPPNGDDLRGQLAWDGRALGGTLRLSRGVSFVGPHRRVVTCSTSGPMLGIGGLAGV